MMAVVSTARPSYKAASSSLIERSSQAPSTATPPISLFIERYRLGMGNLALKGRGN
jgi:hypothetical protein